MERSPPFFRTVYPNRNHVTTHPAKAMEIYQQKVADFSARFESSSENLKAIIQECDNVSSDTPNHIIDAIRQSLLQEFGAFKKVFAEFSQYLLQTGTEYSISKNLTLSTKYTTIYASVDSCFNKLVSTCTPERAEPNAATSVYSLVTSSKRSKTSTMIARMLAKAEAAKAKLEFSEKEAKLKLEQSQIEEQEQIAAAAAARKKVNSKLSLN